MLVDTNDQGAEPRLLFYFENSVTDGRRDSGGAARVISRRLQFVEIGRDGRLINAGAAPYLDYTPPTADQRSTIVSLFDEPWLNDGVERTALEHAIRHLVPEHLGEVKARREALVDKTLEQVQARLLAEIRYWDQRTNELKAREEAGRGGDKLNSANARKRANDLEERLRKRKADLALERQVSARPPNVLGGALIVPMGWFATGAERSPAIAMRETPPPRGVADREVERLAMEAVLAHERSLSFDPRDVSKENRGYDIESRYPPGHPKAGQLRFIEVKGRVAGADTVTITKNEILTALNKPDDYILAVVFVTDAGAEKPRYLTRPFEQEPDFAAASVTFRIRDLLERSDLQTA